jgi:hypothetical protein
MESGRLDFHQHSSCRLSWVSLSRTRRGNHAADAILRSTSRGRGCECAAEPLAHLQHLERYDASETRIKPGFEGAEAASASLAPLPRPAASLALRAVGVALPPTIRRRWRDRRTLTRPIPKCSAKPPSQRNLCWIRLSDARIGARRRRGCPSPAGTDGQRSIRYFEPRDRASGSINHFERLTF